MQGKTKEKQRAIELRKQGKTYNEILEVVPVAKSTLSLWLRSVGLSKEQNQRLTAKKWAAQIKGGARRHTMRIEETQSIYTEAAREVGKLSERERWLIGVALYWAEGAKEKKENTGQSVDFGNMDSEMIRFYLRWLRESLLVDPKDITFSLYIHKNHEERIDDVIAHWKKAIQLPRMRLNFIYYKKHNPKTRRKNIGESYYGTLRVRVVKSSKLQRKISGWTYGITEAPCRIV